MLQEQFAEIISIIKHSRSKAIKAANTELINHYWLIGEYIFKRVENVEWGQAIVEQLAEFIQQTEPDLKGYSNKNLWRMKQFYEAYKDIPKLSTLLREISWSHNLAIFSRCKTVEEREFYLKLSTQKNFSFRELNRQISSSLFERTMIGNTKLSTPLREIHPDITNQLKDSYVLLTSKKQAMKRLLLLFTIGVLLFASCKKNDTPSGKTKTNLGGLVEKGPFIRGSKVSIIELDNNLNPTGNIFETEIQNDEGFFELKNIELASKYVQVSVNGFYFNEITGRLSTSQISLGAFADVQNESTINTNILTHIEQRRVKYLISKNNMSFKEAKKQAQNEILKAFYIKEELNTSSEKMSITNNDENADILLAVSSAILNGIYSDAEFTEWISNIAENIEKDGHLNKANDAAVVNAIENLPLEQIKKNVFARYEKFGKEIEVGDLDKYFTIDIKLPDESGSIGEDDLFRSYEDYIIALNASMSSFTQQLESYYLIEALYSNSTAPDNLLPGTLSEIYDHNLRSSNGDISNLFSTSYQAIRRFNTIADHASESTDPKIKTLEYLTYPYLANIYWSMMEIWGDVVYVTPAYYDDINQSPYIARSTMNDVRTNLIEKLEASVQNIEFGKTNLQVDKAFPLSVLVRLSLQAKDYSRAKLYAEQIINSNRYQLSSTAELHSLSKESILGYQKNAFYETSGHHRMNYLNLINKGDFIHAVRYTEIILAAAEASVKLGEQTNALKYLNQVRDRNNKDAFSSSNKEEILTAILLETKEDLGKEGLWFPALKRNGLAIKELNIPEYRLLFPIPQREVDLNPNMTQNPGY